MSALLADIQGLADAHDGADAVGQRRCGLFCDELIGFAVVLAALGVAHHCPGAAQGGEHLAGYLTGVGAGLVLGDVLRAIGELQVVTVDERLNRADIGERDHESHVDLFVVFLRQGESELLEGADSFLVVEVHLPVTSDKRGTCHD